MGDVPPIRPIEILLVEDDEADIRLTQEALTDAKVKNTLHIARDGVEAMGILRAREDDPERLRPDLVLLDLNLPRKSGQAVLDEVKSDPDLRRIPIVILTTSSQHEDILGSYDLGANAYVTKPVTLGELTKVVDAVDDFWLSIVQLPRT